MKLINMTKKLSIGLLVFSIGSTNVFAEDLFGQRVQRAKLVEESTEGMNYQKQLWDQVGNYTANVMQQCFPKNTKADTDSFTLVADVLHNCHLDQVEVKPKTKMSQCFADGFSRGAFPKPPESFSEDGMPIEIDFKITP